MLEAGEALATWRLEDDPLTLSAGLGVCTVQARRIGDHRRAYLDYEGPVSGNRGQVRRVDRGTYVTQDQQPAGWTVRLAGSRLSGTFRLAAGPGSGDLWELERLGP